MSALAGLAAAVGAALVAWHALGAMWVLACACTHRTLNLRHSAPLVRKLATGAAIIALSCAPASANDDNLGWGAHGPSPSATASATATPTSHASATPTSHTSARARATTSPSASSRPSARSSASPSRSSTHPRTGGPGSKTPAVKSSKAAGAKTPGSKASPKAGGAKAGSNASPNSGGSNPASAQRSGTCVPAPDAKPAPVIRQHLVLAGESLWSISLQWLQQNGIPSPTNGQVAQLSKQIFAANAALIGSNPDLIRPGLALTIPTKG